MAKITEDIDDDFEDDLDEEEEAIEPKAKKMGRPSTKQQTREVQIESRFATFAQPERIGILNTEENKVVGEGANLLPAVLAEILNRLDRIEIKMGNI